jgi:predicted enzyme related to lactoylglutathione lyase
VRFYVELIGCEEVFRFEDAYVGLAGPLTLGLLPVQELEPAGRVTFWLYCDDADAEIERLRAAGVEVVRERRTWNGASGRPRAVIPRDTALLPIDVRAARRLAATVRSHARPRRP